MNSAMLTTIAATGFTVAFFHAAIPTHWLPFVLVARARGWRRGKGPAGTAGGGGRGGGGPRVVRPGGGWVWFLGGEGGGGGFLGGGGGVGAPRGLFSLGPRVGW